MTGPRAQGDAHLWPDLRPAAVAPFHPPPVTGQAGPGLREGTSGTSGEGQQGTAVWFGIEDLLLMVWGTTQRGKTLFLLQSLSPGPQLSSEDAATDARRVPPGIGT